MAKRHYIPVTADIPGAANERNCALIRKVIRTALAAEGVSVPCEVDVLLTNDENIHQINKDMRDVDRATDVLSFPMNELTPGDFDPEMCETDPDSGLILLGDMMISVPRCQEQGEEFGHGYEREIMYLTVHSVLHLLGYDHVDEGEMKRRMRQREKEIMGDKD